MQLDCTPPHYHTTQFRLIFFFVMAFVYCSPVFHQTEDALLPIAEAEAEAAKADGGQPKLIFFTVKSEASLPTQVRNVCDLKKVSDAPQV